MSGVVTIEGVAKPAFAVTKKSELLSRGLLVNLDMEREENQIHLSWCS